MPMSMTTVRTELTKKSRKSSDPASTRKRFSASLDRTGRRNPENQQGHHEEDDVLQPAQAALVDRSQPLTVTQAAEASLTSMLSPDTAVRYSSWSAGLPPLLVRRPGPHGRSISPVRSSRSLEFGRAACPARLWPPRRRRPAWPRRPAPPGHDRVLAAISARLMSPAFCRTTAIQPSTSTASSSLVRGTRSNRSSSSGTCGFATVCGVGLGGGSPALVGDTTLAAMTAAESTRPTRRGGQLFDQVVRTRRNFSYSHP